MASPANYTHQREAPIVERESGVARPVAQGLVALAGKLRGLRDRGLAEVPSTRLLVATGRLIAGGVPVREACEAALLSPLTDDAALLGAMRDLVHASFE